MKASPAQVERQRRIVTELRRRLAFEALVLERMEGVKAEPDEAAPKTIGEVLARARRRGVEPGS